jgi:hypothetical protein
MRVPILSTVADGWRLTVRLLLRLLRRFLRFLQGRRRDDCGAPRRYRDVDCLTPPRDIRARPDPSIYSQEWLMARGFAVTWDNPDFRVLDAASGTEVDRFSLLPDHDYIIEARIHNNSLMAAIGTRVDFEVRAFGIGTPPLSALGGVTLDVPATGNAPAQIAWHTPGSGGHNCLRALISHIDDANPQNNVGQHNTDIAVPASPTRALTFLVGNDGGRVRRLNLRLNAYALPDEAPCAKSFEERNSVTYLRRLQAAHDVRRFPVPEELGARLSFDELEFHERDVHPVTLTLDPAAATGPRRAINVEGYEDGRLVGGLTAYVGGEVA